MSRGFAIFAVVLWVVALVSVLGICWQTRRAQAEMDAVTRATRAEIARSFAESQAAMAESLRSIREMAAQLRAQAEGRP